MSKYKRNRDEISRLYFKAQSLGRINRVLPWLQIRAQRNEIYNNRPRVNTLFNNALVKNPNIGVNIPSTPTVNNVNAGFDLTSATNNATVNWNEAGKNAPLEGRKEDGL